MTTPPEQRHDHHQRTSGGQNRSQLGVGSGEHILTVQSVVASVIAVIIAGATASTAAFLMHDVPATAEDLIRLAAPNRVAADYAINVYTDHHTCNLDEPEVLAKALEHFGTLTGTKITHTINGTVVTVTATRTVRTGVFEYDLGFTAQADLSTSESQFEISRAEVCRLLAHGRR